MRPGEYEEDAADAGDARSSTPALKALIVDPDRVSRRVIETALEPLGCEIETANDGTSGLEVLQREHIDVIIAEAVLDDMPGRMLIQRAWETCGRSLPLFLFVTADERVDTRAGVLRGGADGCMTKPVAADELRAHVEGALIRRNRQGASLPPTVAFAGNGDQISMADLLPVLEHGRRTGELQIAFGSALGRIWVRDGEPIQAEFSSLRGEAAFFALVRCEGVHFRFEVRPVDAPRTIQRSISQLLFAAAQSGGTKRTDRESNLRELGVTRSGWRTRRMPRAYERRIEQRGELARQLIGALTDHYRLGDLELEAKDPSMMRELAATNLIIELWADLSDGIVAMLELASPLGHDALLLALTHRARSLNLSMVSRSGNGGMILRLVDVSNSNDDTRSVAPDMLVIAPPHGELLAISPPRMADLALLATHDRMPSLVVIGHAALQTALARLLHNRATTNIVSLSTTLGEKRGQLGKALIAGLQRWFE